MRRKRSLLSWKLGDYLDNEIGPPEVLIKDPITAEGEQMNESETAPWISDSYQTLLIQKDAESDI